jgi:hypothetical protein
MLQIAARVDLRPGTPLQRQDKLRDTIRDWLLMIMSKHQVSQRQLGLRSQVSPTTINRALSDDGEFVMSTTIISKISASFGEPPPQGLGLGAGVAPRAHSESDVVPFVGKTSVDGPALEEAIERLFRAQVTSDVLNLEGFRRGDVADFDLVLKPEAGDIVVAQVKHLQRGGSAETVMRVFQPPYLLTRSTDASIDQRPLYVDGERIVILGTFVRLIRERAQ